MPSVPFRKVTLRKGSKSDFGFTIEGNSPVRISFVDVASPAHVGGLREGDVVMSLNREVVASASQKELAAIFSKLTKAQLKVVQMTSYQLLDFRERIQFLGIYKMTSLETILRWNPSSSPSSPVSPSSLNTSLSRTSSSSSFGSPIDPGPSQPLYRYTKHPLISRSLLDAEERENNELVMRELYYSMFGESDTDDKDSEGRSGWSASPKRKQASGNRGQSPSREEPDDENSMAKYQLSPLKKGTLIDLQPVTSFMDPPAVTVPLQLQAVPAASTPVRKSTAPSPAFGTPQSHGSPPQITISTPSPRTSAARPAQASPFNEVANHLSGKNLKVAVSRTKLLQKTYEELKREEAEHHELESIRAKRGLNKREQERLKRASSVIEENQAEAARLPKVLTLRGATGRGAIVNGTYQREFVLDGRPIYMHRKPLPSEYASAAGKRLYLYFHESSECWVISTTLGSIDVVAFCPDLARHPHETRAPWMIAMASGLYNEDPSISIDVNLTKRVSFNEMRLSEVKTIPGNGDEAEEARNTLPSVLFEGLRPSGSESSSSSSSSSSPDGGQGTAEAAVEVSTVSAEKLAAQQGEDVERGATPPTPSEAVHEENSRDRRSSVLSEAFLQELLSGGKDGGSPYGYQTWEPQDDKQEGKGNTDFKEEERQVRLRMQEARRAKSKVKGK